jgi:hypothetical protein
MAEHEEMAKPLTGLEEPSEEEAERSLAAATEDRGEN